MPGILTVTSICFVSMWERRRLSEKKLRFIMRSLSAEALGIKHCEADIKTQVCENVTRVLSSPLEIGRVVQLPYVELRSPVFSHIPTRREPHLFFPPSPAVTDIQRGGQTCPEDVLSQHSLSPASLCRWPPGSASDLWKVLTLSLLACALSYFTESKWVRTDSVNADRCVCECVSDVGVNKWVSWGFLHACVVSAPAFVSRAVGFLDVGMHTSAAAMHSALPLLIALIMTGGKARPRRNMSLTVATTVTSSFFLSHPPSLSFPLLCQCEGGHNGTFFRTHWQL